MEAKSRFRLLHEKPEGWISGETPSRLYLCTRRNVENTKLFEEGITKDRKDENTKSERGKHAFKIESISENFGISTFRHFAIKIIRRKYF
jgi:hypothetical protein